jgi:hypothetical protein
MFNISFSLSSVRFIANNFETFAHLTATNAVRAVYNTAIWKTVQTTKPQAIILDNLVIFPLRIFMNVISHTLKEWAGIAESV